MHETSPALAFAGHHRQALPTGYPPLAVGPSASQGPGRFFSVYASHLILSHLK